MKKSILTILFTIIILSILFLSVNLIYSFVKGQPPRILGYELKTVTSGSMEPTIQTGSLIFIKKIEPFKLKVNDTITFKDSNNKELITHRIVEVINDNGEIEFKTKGDNNDIEDTGLVPSYAVVGRMDYKIKYLGIIFLFLKTTQGMVVTFGIVLVFAVIIDLFKNKKLKEGVINNEKIYEV